METMKFQNDLVPEVLYTFTNVFIYLPNWISPPLPPPPHPPRTITHRRFYCDCSGAVCDRAEIWHDWAPHPHSIQTSYTFVILRPGQVTNPWHNKLTSARLQNATTLQHCQWQAIFLRKMILSESAKPPSTLRKMKISESTKIFHACHLRSGQSRDLAHYKPMWEYWNCSFCNTNYIIQTQTHKILLEYTAGMLP